MARISIKSTGPAIWIFYIYFLFLCEQNAVHLIVLSFFRHPSRAAIQKAVPAVLEYKVPIPGGSHRLVGQFSICFLTQNLDPHRAGSIQFPLSFGVLGISPRLLHRGQEREQAAGTASISAVHSTHHVTPGHL